MTRKVDIILFFTEKYRNFQPKIFSFSRYEHDVDKTMTQLQFIRADGHPMGVINWFAVHPTSMNNTNRLVSSDNVGYAAILFEKIMNEGDMVGKVKLE